MTYDSCIREILILKETNYYLYLPRMISPSLLSLHIPDANQKRTMKRAKQSCARNTVSIYKL